MGESAREDELLSVSDVMTRLGIGRMTVLREFHAGRLRGRRVSLARRSPILIEAASVAEYERRLKAQERGRHDR